MSDRFADYRRQIGEAKTSLMRMRGAPRDYGTAMGLAASFEALLIDLQKRAVTLPPLVPDDDASSLAHPVID